MKKSIQRLLQLALFLACFNSIRSQQMQFKLDTISNYNNWGWEALVIQNEYITVAIVPEMGGNILQYDFGVDTFLLLEPNTFGKSYAAGSGISPFDGSWGFGGYETWPTPERWPPPANLTFRKFSYVVASYNADSITIILKSEKDTETFPGLQYERRITAYNHCTKVKVENTLINVYSKPVEFGLMNVSYVIGNHANMSDYSNFPISFAVNPASKFEQGGVYFEFNQHSPSFLGQLNPGIYTVEYQPTLAKIFADVADGWAGFVDKKDTQAYIRIFDVFEGETYADNGSRFEIFVSADPHFMALEVTCPMRQLTANGGRYTFDDNLFSTKLNRTILKATHAGAATERLQYDSVTHRVTGTFGVFRRGEVRLAYYDSIHHLLLAETSTMAYPDTAIVVDESIDLPATTNYIALEAYSTDHVYIDILDQIDFSAKNVSVKKQTRAEKPLFGIRNTMLRQHDVLTYEVNNAVGASVVIQVCDITGKVVEHVFNGTMPAGAYNGAYPLKGLVPGMYVVVCSSNGRQVCDKIIVTK